MGQNRNASGAIKTALVRKLRADFDVNNVMDLAQIPLIIQDRPLNSIDEPYIYLYEQNSSEVDRTYDESSTEYDIIAQVVTRVAQNDDSSQLRDDIVQEVVRIIDTNSSGYINLETMGFNVYLQNVNGVAELPKYEERGGTYFQANITITLRADFVGLPTTIMPTEASSYSFTNFTFTPNNTDKNIEFGDAGTITGATTYRNQLPWNFESVSYAQISGGDGALTDNVYTVESADATLGLNATINFTFHTDSSVTTSITNTDQFNRIRSLRYGAINQSSISQSDLANFSLFQGTNKTFDFGNVNPTGDAVELSGAAGERFYFIIDANHSITSIRNFLGLNVIEAFSQTTVNGYKIYLQNNPLVYTTTSPIEYTLN